MQCVDAHLRSVLHLSQAHSWDRFDIPETVPTYQDLAAKAGFSQTKKS